jgi:hypothetical protein
MYPLKSKMAPEYQRPTAISILTHTAGLYVTRYILRHRGLYSALKWASRVESHPRRAATQWPTPATSLRSVVIAAAFCPTHFRCLEQSLVLYRTLRQHGYDASLRIGATGYAFRAHAWIEIDGQPLNELPERVRLFKTFSLPTDA